MAGLISRLKRITVSRINALLETVEDPEAVLPQSIGGQGILEKPGQRLLMKYRACNSLIMKMVFFPGQAVI